MTKRFWQTSLGIPLYIEERSNKSIRILGKIKARNGRFIPEAEGENLPLELTEIQAKTAVEKAIKEQQKETADDPTPPDAA